MTRTEFQQCDETFINEFSIKFGNHGYEQKDGLIAIKYTHVLRDSFLVKLRVIFVAISVILRRFRVHESLILRFFPGIAPECTGPNECFRSRGLLHLLLFITAKGCSFKRKSIVIKPRFSLAMQEKAQATQ